PTETPAKASPPESVKWGPAPVATEMVDSAMLTSVPHADMRADSIKSSNDSADISMLKLPPGEASTGTRSGTIRSCRISLEVSVVKLSSSDSPVIRVSIHTGLVGTTPQVDSFARYRPVRLAEANDI